MVHHLTLAAGATGAMAAGAGAVVAAERAEHAISDPVVIVLVLIAAVFILFPIYQNWSTHNRVIPKIIKDTQDFVRAMTFDFREELKESRKEARLIREAYGVIDKRPATDVVHRKREPE